MLVSFRPCIPLKTRHKLLRAVPNYDYVQPSNKASQVRAPWADVQPAPPIEISYSDFLTELSSGDITRVEIAQSQLELRAYTKYSDEFPLGVVLPKDSNVITELLKKHVAIQVLRPKEPFLDVPTLIMYIFEFVLFFAIFRIFSGLGGGGGGNPLKGFGETQARLDEEPKTGVTFNDVAGCDNAKQDLRETVDFLKNPQKYTALGAKMPKGVLLIGPPGTGKTKLAKAVAGEAGVPFFSCSGSEFVEMFVGVGSARVRSLFQRAEEKSPCIIFIDEIDAIGKKRGGGMFGGGGHEEHDQTINQLLTAMDGFAPSKGVIVLGATNRPEILDDALLRPGRFDRQVRVDLPDVRGREAILSIHVKNKPIADDVEIDKLAKVTVGFSGADLENLCNEASIYAARRSSVSVCSQDFDMALEKLTLGEEKRNSLITEEKRELVAYHEAGHALLGMVLDGFDKVRKISIVPRGVTGGATYFEPKEDTDLVTREYLEHQIMVALGGRIAEELVFGDKYVTNGASGDFMKVTELASMMVTQFGFSNNLAPMYLGESEGLAGEIDTEINNIVQDLYCKAVVLMKHNEEVLHELAGELLEKETLNESDLQKYAERLCGESM
jgi:cell division protease FtsH